GAVHDVVEDFERGQAPADGTTQRQNSADNQRADTEVEHPGGGHFARSEHERLSAEDGAEQKQRNQALERRGLTVFLHQVGETHHGGQGKGAVTDEVRRHVQLHPPAFQSRHQGLDLESVAGERVPQQEYDGGRNHQQHEAAQRPGGVTPLVVQVEQRRDQREQHKDFVQITDRDVTDVRSQQVTFAPADEHADGTGIHCGPGQPGTQPSRRIAYEAYPIADGGQYEQCAHPEYGGLRRQQVLQQEYGLGPGDVALMQAAPAAIQPNRAQRDQTRYHGQRAQRPPEPSHPYQHRYGTGENRFLVDIHGLGIRRQGID